MVQVQGKWATAMLADYCWFLIRKTPTSSFHKKAKRTKSRLFLCPTNVFTLKELRKIVKIKKILILKA